MRGLRGSAARDDQEIENRHVRRRINETDLNCNVRKFPSETLLLCCFVYKNTYILYID